MDQNAQIESSVSVVVVGTRGISMQCFVISTGSVEASHEWIYTAFWK